MKAEVWLDIPAHADREKIVSALANSGYNVRVEVKVEHYRDHYFVVFSPKKEADRGA